MASMTRNEEALKNLFTHGVKDSLRRRWDKKFLRGIGSHLTIGVSHNPQSFSTHVTCSVGMSDMVYESSILIDEGVLESGELNQHPDWIEHQSQAVVRMAETGIFMRFFEQALEPKHRPSFKRMHSLIKSVNLIPPNHRDEQVNDRWLAVVIFSNGMGQYRETMREIADDPHHFLALLTMVQK